MAVSQVDPSIPPDNVKADKAKIRLNFQVAYNELSKLLSRTSPVGRMAFDDTQFDDV